jgi:hypothetical protein
LTRVMIGVSACVDGWAIHSKGIRQI